jgi:5-formyltetrahydrofolate cyclo-ligase
MPPEASSGAWRRGQRRRLIEARMAMPDDVRRMASQAIERALETLAPPGRFHVIAGYWPVRGEFDPLPYLRRCLAAGAAAALPVAPDTAGPLRFRLWRPESKMERGRFDILHPADAAEAVPVALLVPLVGFDAAGHRLGYGGGFFDRTLATIAPRPVAIGVGFELGRFADLGPGPRDQPMDAIVTEAGGSLTSKKAIDQHID